MLAPLLAASVLAPSAADFFPLVTGARRTYEERLEGHSMSVNVDEVGAAVEVASGSAIPVVTTEGGRKISTTFYRVDGNTVFLVGSDPKKPLPSPMPILRLEGERAKWNYSGPSDDTSNAEPITVAGEAKLLGEREVLGKKVPVLEVKLTSTYGGGQAQEKIEQVSLYGRGIGLMQSNSKTTVAKRSVKSELRLVSVEEAKTGG